MLGRSSDRGITGPPARAGQRPSACLQTLLREVAGPSRPLAEGAFVVHEGDHAEPCYWLESGWLAFLKSLPDGRDQIIDIHLGGELIQPLTADGRTAGGGLQALAPSVVAAIPAGRWERLRAGSELVRRAAEQQGYAVTARRDERMLRLGRGSAATRLAYLLIEMQQRLGVGRPAAPVAFHLPMTQRQIGDFAGLCSVHVSRVFGQFAREGILSTRDHTDVVLHDFDRLCTHAGVVPEALRRAIIAPR